MKSFILISCLLALAACAQPGPTTTLMPLPSTETVVPPTANLTPTTLPPTGTPTILPATKTVTNLLLEELYVSEVYGYSFAYPNGWHAVEMQDMLILVADPAAISTSTPTQALIVFAGELDTFLGGMLVALPLEGAATELRAVVPQLVGPGYRLGEFESLALGELPAIGASFGGEDESGVPIQGYIVLTLSGEHAAILLGSAPADQWAGFELLYRIMLDTFIFTDS
jgi:hypothetical protein